jgi:hypothetical protein
MEELLPALGKAGLTSGSGLHANKEEGRREEGYKGTKGTKMTSGHQEEKL